MPPVAVMPVPMVPVTMPAPTPVMPMPPAVMPMMSPAHLLGFQRGDFVTGCHGGVDITVLRSRPLFNERYRRNRRSICRCHSAGRCQCGPGGGAHSKTHRQSKKFAALHPLLLVSANKVAERMSRSWPERWLNCAFRSLNRDDPSCRSPRGDRCANDENGSRQGFLHGSCLVRHERSVATRRRNLTGLRQSDRLGAQEAFAFQRVFRYLKRAKSFR